MGSTPASQHPNRFACKLRSARGSAEQVALQGQGMDQAQPAEKVAATKTGWGSMSVQASSLQPSRQRHMNRSCGHAEREPNSHCNLPLSRRRCHEASRHAGAGRSWLVITLVCLRGGVSCWVLLMFWMPQGNVGHNFQEAWVWVGC